MNKTIYSLIGICAFAIATHASAGEVHGCIGAALESQQGISFIQADLVGSPAAAAGLAPGDVILAVQSTPDSEMAPVAGMQLKDVVQLIRGEVGTTVVLDVLRDGQTLEFSIVRKPYQD